MLKRKTKKEKKIARGDINYKKLFFETMIVLTVVFFATIATLYPALKAAGAFDEKRKYAEFDSLIEEVENYDYSKGRDTELEKRLDMGFAETKSGPKTYFYALARGIYYCNIGYSMTAKDAFSYVEHYMPDGLTKAEQYEHMSKKVLCERKLANE
ncbi:hypothetical protein IJ768_03050 [Candidatus Saccharibacteria bacterium]|nr:hypothetical protein [Candidatus Saccharibacteria bacterium]